MAVAGHPYPAGFSVDAPEQVTRWRPLVQWLLAIPHFVVLYALGIVSQVVAIISWFAILFTGKLPSGLAGVQALYVRYENRVYTYAGFLLEGYPPFSFDTANGDPGNYAGTQTDFEPQLADRNRLTTAFRWILAIPHIIALALLGIAAWVAWIVALFAILFTGCWPAGLREFVVGYMRWATRVSAYVLLLTDEYPPFAIK